MSCSSFAGFIGGALALFSQLRRQGMLTPAPRPRSRKQLDKSLTHERDLRRMASGLQSLMASAETLTPPPLVGLLRSVLLYSYRSRHPPISALRLL